MHKRIVTVIESGNGPYGQFITAGDHVLGADERGELGGRNTGPILTSCFCPALEPARQ